MNALTPYTNPRIPSTLSIGQATNITGDPAVVTSLNNTVSTTSSAFVTSVNVSAPGVLTIAGIYNLSGANIGGSRFRVIIDGQTPIDWSGTVNNQTGFWVCGSVGFQPANNFGTATHGYMPFSSLQIDFHSNGTDTLNNVFRYYLT